MLLFNSEMISFNEICICARLTFYEVFVIISALPVQYIEALYAQDTNKYQPHHLKEEITLIDLLKRDHMGFTTRLSN